MHEIQARILKRLTLAEKLRYSDIKPPQVGGNHFAYHLKKVMDAGLVEKTGVFYKLTVKGARMSDRMSLKTFRKRIQPKIVTMIVCRNERGEILLYKINRQPFFGKLTLPYGKLHCSEMVEDAALREVAEKTGLQADKLDHRGEVYFLIYDGDKLVTHMLAHVFEGNFNAADVALPQNCAWIKSENIDHKKTIPGIKDVLRLVKKTRGRFFHELYWEI